MRMRGFFARWLAAACVPVALWVPLGGAGASAQVPPSCDPSLPCRLSVNLPETQGFTSFHLAPNGERVVFIHVGDGAIRQLYSAPVAGGESPTKLNVPTVDQIHDAAISPDSTRVVYSASEPGASERHLFSVPITGPARASVRLDAPPAATTDEGLHKVSADSAWVVYAVADDSNAWAYSVPVAGPASASVPVIWPSPTGALFTLSPDSAHVIWLLDLADLPDPLFSTPIAGPLGDSVRINGDEQLAGSALVNASSTRAVYIAQAPGRTERDVFSVPISGSGPRYNLTASLDAPFIQGPVALTADGQRVVYAAQEPNGGFHLYSSRLVPSP